MTKYTLLVFGLTLIVGCTKEIQYVKISANTSPVMLTEVTNTTLASVKALSPLEESKEPMQVSTHDFDTAAYAMNALASVDWHGPAEPLIKRLAKMDEYKVTTFGKQPILPILVSINKKEEYSGNIMRDISLQAQDKMKLVVYPNNKLIELHYLDK